MRTNTINKSSVVRISAQPFLDEIKKVEVSTKDRVLEIAIVTSRPGQEGIANGYILQGEELDFFQSKLKKGRITV